MPPPSTRTASWRHAPDGVEVRVADRPVLLLIPADGRVRVGLVMPVVDRVIDVSVQPATSCRTLDEAARRSRTPASSVDAAARSALREAAQLAGCWSPPDHLCRRRAFGGVAFPLLAGAFEVGAAPVDEVPRWAAPVLASRPVGDAARGACAAHATRPVRRALVRALEPRPSGEVDLAVLALALIGATSLEPDRLARVLQTVGVAHPVADLPDPAELRTARAVVEEWGEERLEPVLVEAAGRADGLRVLMETIGYARQLGDHVPHPLPRTLNEVHDVHRTLMRSAPPAVAEPPPRHEPPRPQEPAALSVRPDRPRRVTRPAPHAALPPPSRLATTAGSRMLTPSRVRALDGSSVGELTLVLPHGDGDLPRWGRLLSNCLADFGSAVRSGRSVVVGVLRRNRLLYALELTPAGVLRQFNGARNRPPAPGDLRAVIGLLVRAEVLDVAATANRLWLEAAGLRGDSRAG